MTPRFWHAANARSAWSYTTGMLSSGSPPKNVSVSRFGFSSSRRCSIHAGQPGAVVERHLVGVLVVVAVIPLEAVVAGKVALQRRQHRDAHLLGVFAVVREELVQRFGVGRAARDDESVLGERHERLARVAVEPLGCERRGSSRQTIEQAGDVLRDDELRVRERVHQEHFAAFGERDTNVEHRLLHRFETCRWSAG